MTSTSGKKYLVTLVCPSGTVGDELAGQRQPFARQSSTARCQVKDKGQFAAATGTGQQSPDGTVQRPHNGRRGAHGTVHHAWRPKNPL